jgi:hypothetical protein
MPKTRTLRLVKETKLEELIAPPRSGAVFEASGVVTHGDDAFVALDNVRRVLRIRMHFRRGSSDHQWVGNGRQGEGYEAIAYNPARRRFFLMIEALKHPDGTFKGVIEEYDDDWRFRGRRWVDFPFEKRNTGFEGLASVDVRGEEFLLALCEGNACRGGRKSKERGRGRIEVLQRRGRMWHPVDRIKLPRHLGFKDYAGLSFRGGRLAVVSQESSRVWIGRLRVTDWKIEGRGEIYDFPRTKKGKKLYYTVEGISWLSAHTIAAVSDLRKKRYPKRSARTDQSIHVFRVGR